MNTSQIDHIDRMFDQGLLNREQYVRLRAQVRAEETPAAPVHMVSKSPTPPPLRLTPPASVSIAAATAELAPKPQRPSSSPVAISLQPEYPAIQTRPAAKPVAAEPVAAEPVAVESTAVKLVVSEPVAAAPAIPEPLVAEPIVSEPVIAKPATPSLPPAPPKAAAMPPAPPKNDATPPAPPKVEATPAMPPAPPALPAAPPAPPKLVAAPPAPPKVEASKPVAPKAAATPVIVPRHDSLATVMPDSSVSERMSAAVASPMSSGPTQIPDEDDLTDPGAHMSPPPSFIHEELELDDFLDEEATVIVNEAAVLSAVELAQDEPGLLPAASPPAKKKGKGGLLLGLVGGGLIGGMALLCGVGGLAAVALSSGMSIPGLDASSFETLAMDEAFPTEETLALEAPAADVTPKSEVAAAVAPTEEPGAFADVFADDEAPVADALPAEPADQPADDVAPARAESASTEVAPSTKTARSEATVTSENVDDELDALLAEPVADAEVIADDMADEELISDEDMAAIDAELAALEAELDADIDSLDEPSSSSGAEFVAPKTGMAKTGVTEIDQLFNELEAIKDQAAYQKGQVKTAEANFKSALGASSSMDLGSALGWLNEKAEGNISVNTSGAVPKITATGTVDAETGKAISAANRLFSAAAKASKELDGGDVKAASMADSARNYPPKVALLAERAGMDKDEVNVAKQATRHNIKLSKKIPNEVESAVDYANSVLSQASKAG